MKIKRLTICLCILIVGNCYGLTGDFNNDGIVDFLDFAIFAEQWLAEEPNMPVEPLFEYSADSKELAVIRDSIGYQIDVDEIYEVSANTKRTTMVCLSSRPTLTVDTLNTRRCWGIDGELVICSDETVLYTTTEEDFGDGSSPLYTEVVDVSSDGPFSAYYNPDDAVRSLKVMADGSWVLCMGQDGAGQRGYLFLSIDKGQSWQICKFSDGTDFRFDSGYIDYWGWTGVIDNEVVIGEYGYRLQGDNPRRVYYSDDYGATWTKIYEPTAQNGRHCHLTAFAPCDTSTIYASYGDSDAYRQLVKLSHTGGSKKDPNNWTDEVITKTQPTSACSDDSYLYFGRDGSTDKHSLIIRLNPTDDSLKSVLNIPARQADSNDVPYIMTGAIGDIFNIFIHNDVLYASVRGKDITGASEQIYGGIYVSKDGENWVCAYRMSRSGYGSYGISDIRGYTGGYLWGTLVEYRSKQLFKMRPLSVANVTALTAEVGIINLLSEDESKDFGGTFSGTYWRAYGFPNNNLSLAQSNGTSEPALIGDYSLKVTGIDNGGDYGMMAGPNILLEENDIVCCTFWIKGASSWPANYETKIEWRTTKITGRTSYFQVTDAWQKIAIWGKCNTTNDISSIRLTFDDDGGGNHSDAVCYIDAVKIVKFNNRHYSGTWQVGDTARDDEYGVYPLCGVGETFTTTFEWHPLMGEGEFKEDIAIACWVGLDCSYINLIWEQSSKKFKLVDDNGDVLASSNTYPFQHCDFVRFALVSDGIDSVLFIEDSLHSMETINLANTVNLGATPVALKLGTTYHEDLWGCGCFSNVKAWDLELSSLDIAEVFSAVD